MELWVTTSDVNLIKLVPLVVHSKLKNAKIAKKYFLMLKWGVPYARWKAKEKRISNKLKNTHKSNTWLERYGPGKSQD